MLLRYVIQAINQNIHYSSARLSLIENQMVVCQCLIFFFAPVLWQLFKKQAAKAQFDTKSTPYIFITLNNSTFKLAIAFSGCQSAIEHVWNMLQTAISRRNIQPQSLHELGVALTEEWNNLRQRDVRTLIRSTERRCQAIIRAHGGHTRY